ncbi:MAG: hypothetical protein IPN32_10065 [Deltaproteobacteria bacterium]|nr:hypothetical protein [Deltaproteobacteria bacterium]
MMSLDLRSPVRRLGSGRVAVSPALTALVAVVALALPPGVHAAARRGPAEPAETLAPEPAAEVTPEPAVADAADPAVELSRAHFRRGLAAYEAGDYGEAVTHWTQAHALMATEPELNAARHVLELDLGQAHVRAFERDGDRTHLATARPLLEGFVAWVDRPQHALTTAERDDRARAISMLARIDIEGAAVIPAPTPTAPDARAKPRTARTDAPALDRRQAGRMMIAGGVVLGLGVAAAIGVVALMPRARRIESDYELASEASGGSVPGADEMAHLEDLGQRGRAVNRGVLGLATVAAVGVLVGVPLLAVGGAARRRNARLAPTAGAHELGCRSPCGSSRGTSRFTHGS